MIVIIEMTAAAPSIDIGLCIKELEKDEMR